MYPLESETRLIKVDAVSFRGVLLEVNFKGFLKCPLQN